AAAGAGALRGRSHAPAPGRGRRRDRLAPAQPPAVRLPVAVRGRSRARRRGAARDAVAVLRSQRCGGAAPDRRRQIGVLGADRAPPAGARADHLRPRPGDRADLRRQRLRGHGRLPARCRAAALLRALRLGECLHRDRAAHPGTQRGGAMAGQAWQPAGRLSATAGPPSAPAADDAALRARPHGFELFAALRLLERVHRDRPRLGRSTRPCEDAVRLRQPPFLSFAPGEIAGYRPADGSGPATLDSYVLGLFGPNGPLPLHLTEYAIERAQNVRDTTLRAFADLFHHRLLALFYRAWADAQPVVQGDRPEEDRFRFHVGALIGMDPATGDDVVATGTRYHAGRMLSHARNAEGLRAVLRHAFDVPVQVREFVGEWMPLPDTAWLRLGGSRAVSMLGTNAVLGGRVRGAQHRFRLQLGPLDGPGFRA